MADFDPDAYLGSPTPNAPVFDPDAYLKGTAAPQTGVLSGIGNEIYSRGAADLQAMNAGLNPFSTENRRLLEQSGQGWLAGAGADFQAKKNMLAGLGASADLLAAPITGTVRYFGGKGLQALDEAMRGAAVKLHGGEEGVPPAITYEQAANTAESMLPALAPRGVSPIGPRTVPGPVPTAAELKAAGSAGFEQARNLGVEIKPQSVQDFATRVKADLDSRLGIDENLAPKTHGILSKVEEPPAPGAVATVDNLQSLRRKLGNAASSPDKTERLAASSAKSALDDYLANLPSADVISGNPQTAAAILKEANANYAAAERSNAINAKLVRAELRAAAANSGQNVANTIRQRMADILINPNLQRGYTAAELAQIERIVRGTNIGNTARYAKNIFGGGGGLGTLATGAVGTVAAGPAGIALAAPGVLGRVIADASTMQQVRILDQMLRSRAPLAQARTAVPLRGPSLPLSLLQGSMLSSVAPRALLPGIAGPVPAYADQNK
jgi:hypothetical protein